MFLTELDLFDKIKEDKLIVAIPSNRVNVSYMINLGCLGLGIGQVAIPSNRVNVSYCSKYENKIGNYLPSRNPLKSGQCFLHLKKRSFM